MFSACSDDDVNPDPQLAGPLYGLQKGTPGSIDELIYNIWEDSGVYYLYDYGKSAFLVNNWSGSFSYNNYTPIAETDLDVAKTAIETLYAKVFTGMDGDFIHRNWFVRVFLCDDLLDYRDSKPSTPYLENGDMLIIHSINSEMREYTDADWEKWASNFNDLLISRLYLGASEKPTEFLSLRAKNPTTGRELTYILTSDWIADPEERYSKNMYTFRSYGYIKSRANVLQSETINIVYEDGDVSDYITFLTKTSKEELDWNWARFDLLKQRAKALIPYLYNVLGLDLVSMQNANVPDDPVPAGYFDNL